MRATITAPGLRSSIGRTTIRSTNAEMTKPTAIAIRNESHTEIPDEGEGRGAEGTERADLALREVELAGRAEDHDERKGEQRVDRALCEPVEHALDEERHQTIPPR